MTGFGWLSLLIFALWLAAAAFALMFLRGGCEPKDPPKNDVVTKKPR